MLPWWIVVIPPHLRLGRVRVDHRADTEDSTAVIDVAIEQQHVASHLIQDLLKGTFIVGCLLGDQLKARLRAKDLANEVIVEVLGVRYRATLGAQ